MLKANMDIRTKMREHGIYQWQLAKKLGCCETTMCHMLREPLEPEVRERILSILNRMIRENDSHMKEG